MAWLTLTDAKNFLRKDGSVTIDDTKLQREIDAACDLIEQKKGHVTQTPFTEDHQALRSGIVLLDERPVFSVTSVSILRGTGSGESIDEFDPLAGGTGWTLESAGGVLDTPACQGEWVRVQYVAGYDQVPENFMQAALELVLSNWRATQTNEGAKRPRQAAPAASTDPVLPPRVRELLGLDGKHLTDEVLIA